MLAIDARMTPGRDGGDPPRRRHSPSMSAVLDDATPVISYAPGSWGPKEADALLPDGDVWHDPKA